ncbi:MAG: oligosaccharide flippase family protein [Acidobacteriota bacterium]
MLKVFTNKLVEAAKGRNGATAVMQSLVIKLLVVLLNTSTGIITARMLKPEGRGELAALILWPLFLANALTLGLPSSLVYNLRRDPKRKSHLIAAALMLSVLLGLAATLLGAAFMPHWLAQYSRETIRLAQLMLWYAPLCTLMLIGRAAFEARGDFGNSNATLLFTPFLGLVGLVVLILAKAMTPFHVALAYTLNGVPVLIWVSVRLWRDFRPRWEGMAASIRTLLHYGLRSYGIDLLNALSLQIDQVLVIGFLSPEAMGTYVVALSLSRMLLLFQQSVVMVLFPKLTGRPAAEVIALTGRVARISTVMTLLVGGVVMLWGQWMLRLLYGAEFATATNLLRLLTLEAIITSTALVLAQAFMALGKPGTVTVLQGVGLALSVPLMLVLIPRYGLLGTGLALAISAAVRLVLMMMCFPWLLKERSPKLLFGREDWTFLRQQLIRMYA